MPVKVVIKKDKHRAVKCICDVTDTHKQYWKCLKFRVKIPPVAEEIILDKLSGSKESGIETENAAIMDKDGACGGSEKSDMKAYLESQGYEQMYAVDPREWCPHLEEAKPIPEGFKIDVKAPCVDCDNVGENWICLICYKVFCSRYVNEHMVKHGKTEKHNMVMSFSDLSTWCYVCEDYIDNDAIYPTKREAYKNKFGEEPEF